MAEKILLKFLNYIKARQILFIVPRADGRTNKGQSVGIIKIISNSRVGKNILKKSFSLFLLLLSITENKSEKSKCLRRYLNNIFSLSIWSPPSLSYKLKT